MSSKESEVTELSAGCKTCKLSITLFQIRWNCQVKEEFDSFKVQIN